MNRELLTAYLATKLIKDIDYFIKDHGLENCPTCKEFIVDGHASNCSLEILRDLIIPKKNE